MGADLLERHPRLEEVLSPLPDSELLRPGYRAPRFTPEFLAWQFAVRPWIEEHANGKAKGTLRLVVELAPYFLESGIGHEGQQVLCLTAKQLAAKTRIRREGTAQDALRRLTLDREYTNLRAVTSPPLVKLVEGARGRYGSFYAFFPFLLAQDRKGALPEESVSLLAEAARARKGDWPYQMSG